MKLYSESYQGGEDKIHRAGISQARFTVKKTQNRATVGSQQQYYCSQLQRISIQLSKRIWQMSKRNDTVVYFCGKKQTG